VIGSITTKCMTEFRVILQSVVLLANLGVVVHARSKQRSTTDGAAWQSLRGVTDLVATPPPILIGS
jgi:hypothetical protein